MGEWIFAWAATIFVVGIGAVTQHRTRTIPNALTLPAWFVAPVVHVALGAPLALTLGAALVGLAAALPGFRDGAWGGGAVKLFAAGCATAGVTSTFIAAALALVLYAVLKAYAAWGPVGPSGYAGYRKLDAPPYIAMMLVPGLVLEPLHALG